MKAQPFKIEVEQSVLDDLQNRLKRTRWPDEAEGSGWSMGTNLGYLKVLADYWQHHYDWRKHEEALNQFHQFKTEVDGVTIHFIHERGKGPNPMPIILTHGWPDSVYRFHKVIPMLTDPERYGGKAEDSFDVIVPSIPGFGFSDRQAMPDGRVANLWAKLMTEVLGYEHFAAAGGDVGSMVTKALALQHPNVVTAIHLTDVGYPTGMEDPATLSEAERQFAGFIQQWWFTEGAYAMIQSTKPQSLAYGLNDSPVGLAAWIMSFICIGTTGEEIEKRFSRDELLTNIMIYWLTETAGSSARRYRVDNIQRARATYGHSGGPQPAQKSEVPAAVAVCPWDAPVPREWAERNVNLKRYSEMPRGGHFLAWEEPELYANDVREFVTELHRSR